MRKWSAREWCIELIPLLLFVVGGVWFYWIERSVPPVFYMYSPVDAYIPFLPAMVIPYLSWYFYIGIPGILFFFTDRATFVKLTSFLAAGILLSCFTFIVLPNGQGLRPPFLDGDFLSRVVAYIYEVDTPTNSMPSMHVLFSLGACFAVFDAPRFHGRNMAQVVSILWCAAICLSTVMIKQHSIYDVAGGFLYAGLIWRFIVPRVLSLFEERVWKPVPAKRKAVRAV